MSAVAAERELAKKRTTKMHLSDAESRLLDEKLRTADVITLHTIVRTCIWLYMSRWMEMRLISLMPHCTVLPVYPVFMCANTPVVSTNTTHLRCAWIDRGEFT